MSDFTNSISNRSCALAGCGVVVSSLLMHFYFLKLTANTVVLLDEADVFLEERSLADMQRNALVSGNHISRQKASGVPKLTIMSLSSCT